MRWLRGLGAGLVLILGIAAHAVAATPDGTSAAAAIPLPASSSASGTIPGNPNGSFIYYTFNYPGNGTSATVTLSVSPADRLTSNGVGVNLYQGTTTLLSTNAVSLVPGSNSVAFSSLTAGPVLVQVYNYVPGETASYTFAINGITSVASPIRPTPTGLPTPASAPAPVSSGAPSPPVAPTSVAAGTTAGTAIALPASLSASGAMAGSVAGSFAFYTFNYPGNSAVGTITLNVSPSDPTTTNAVGVNLYQAGETLASINAVSPTPGTKSVEFSSAAAGPLLVQVYNYATGQPVSFTISVTGIAR